MARGLHLLKLLCIFPSGKTSSLVRVKMPFYAVARGKNAGIYGTWAECEANVKGYSGAKFKKFNTNEQALEFISGNGGQSACSAASTSSVYVQPQSNFGKPLIKSIDTYAAKPPPKTRKVNHNVEENAKSGPSNTRNVLKRVPNERNNLNILDDEYERLLSDNGVKDLLSIHMDRIELELKRSNNRIQRITNGESPTTPKTRKRTIMLDNAPASHSTGESPVQKRRKSGHEFTVDSEDYVHVYTDGACSNNGTEKAQAGLGVYFDENHPLNLSMPVSGRATNNCGEIQAASQAIRQARKMGIDKLCINTDSQFLINSATKWMPGWKRKGWKLASGQPVKNEIDFKELEKELSTMKVKWTYVEAHKGIHGNERADELARHGATLYGLKDCF